MASTNRTIARNDDARIDGDICQTADCQHITDSASSSPIKKGDAVLFDMHCHLDFVENAEEFRELAAVCGVTSLSNTITPEDYAAQAEAFAATPYARLALGAHPWRIADGRIGEESLALFEKLASEAHFIGEVGLDFTGDRVESREIQLAAFTRILQSCGEGKVISLHANGAETELLDALEQTDAIRKHNCILHWYAGSSDQLKRAVDMGCLFSVGKRMLQTKRGREYARIIPIGQLLFESDMPSRDHAHYTPAQWNADLTEALLMVAEIRGEDPESILGVITPTSAKLLSR